jgi:WD40 repeat protein
MSIRTFEGHTGNVTCITVFPAMGHFVSGSSDRTLRLWNKNNGETIRTFVGHTGKVTCVALLPDGRILSGSKDGEVRLWDTFTGESIVIFKTEMLGGVVGFAVFSDGSFVICFPGLLTLLIYEYRGWREVGGGFSARPSSNKFTCITTVPGTPDHCFVTGSMEGAIELMTCESQVFWELKTFPNIRGPVRFITFLPNGNFLTNSVEDDQLTLWDKGFVYQRSMDGERLFTDVISHVEEGKKIRDYRRNRATGGHIQQVMCAASFPDGNFVSVSDESIRMWNTETAYSTKAFKERRIVNHTTCIATLPDGNFVTGSENALYLWDSKPRPSAPRNIPRGSSANKGRINEGNAMITFPRNSSSSEYNHEKYYFNRPSIRSLTSNPTTRYPIRPANFIPYRAHLVDVRGGGIRGTKRKSLRNRKTKKNNRRRSMRK